MNDTYIRLEDSNDLRKENLKLALFTTKLMKSTEEAKHIKKEKLEYIEKMSNKINDIKSSINILSKKLPGIKKEQKEVKQPFKKSKEEKKPSTEIEKLILELESIENKLRML